MLHVPNKTLFFKWAELLDKIIVVLFTIKISADFKISKPKLLLWEKTVLTVSKQSPRCHFTHQSGISQIVILSEFNKRGTWHDLVLAFSSWDLGHQGFLFLEILGDNM